MLYARFDEHGSEAELSDDPRYVGVTKGWLEVPEDFPFDLNTERLLLIDGALQKEPIPPYVEPPTYRLYEFIADFEGDRTKPPKNIIFPEQLDSHPQKKTFIALGERIKSLYFADDEYTDPIIKVEYVFNRDEKGYLIDKVRTISFRLSDGSWSADTKVCVIPISSQSERLKEIKARRSNIIDELKGLASSMGIEDRILELFTKFQLEAGLYVDTGSRALHTAIKDNADIAWLNGSLPNGAPARAALLRHLAIGLVS